MAFSLPQQTVFSCSMEIHGTMFYLKKKTMYTQGTRARARDIARASRVPSASSSFDQSYAAFVSWFGTGFILIWLKPSESARNWIFIGLNHFLLAICLHSSIILHACIFRLRMRRQHTRLSSSLKEVIQVLLVMFLVSSMSGGRWFNISGVIRVFIERNNFKSFLRLNSSSSCSFL